MADPKSDLAQLYMILKGIETKVNNLVREVNVLKNDFIRKSNSLSKDINQLNSDLVDVKHGQQKREQTLGLVIKELKQTALKEELAVLKRYIDLWNPLHFVTQNDIERIVSDKISSIKIRPNIRAKRKNKLKARKVSSSSVKKKLQRKKKAKQKK